MYRADLPRTLTLVVALLLTVAPTSIFARGFRAADTRSEGYPAVQALRFYDRANGNAASAQLIERIRKVE